LGTSATAGNTGVGGRRNLGPIGGPGRPRRGSWCCQKNPIGGEGGRSSRSTTNRTKSTRAKVGHTTTRAKRLAGDSCFRGTVIQQSDWQSQPDDETVPENYGVVRGMASLGLICLAVAPTPF